MGLTLRKYVVIVKRLEAAPGPLCYAHTSGDVCSRTAERGRQISIACSAGSVEASKSEQQPKVQKLGVAREPL